MSYTEFSSAKTIFVLFRTPTANLPYRNKQFQSLWILSISGNMPPKMCLSCLQQSMLLPLPRSTTSYTPKRSIKSISNPRQTRFNQDKNLPRLGASTAAALERKAYTTPLRTGALGTKKGMSAIYDTETGRRRACTIVQMDRVQVVAHKTRQQNGYYAVQLGSGWKHPSNVTRPLLGHYAEHGVSPKRYLVEFKVRDEKGLLGVGEMIGAGWFQEGQYVDARANSRGMGFAGGMKRHGFKGQGASHGVSLTHRAMGSAGQSQGGGSRVLPGKRMPGRMGGHQVTTQNVKVMKVDDEKGIVVLNGKCNGSALANLLNKIQAASLDRTDARLSYQTPSRSPGQRSH